MEFGSITASVMTIAVGLIGLFVNINVAYAVKKCRTFGYAFGTLCLSQTVANIGNLCVFVFLTGGITIVEPSWHSTYLGRRSGQLLILFWEASIFTHLFISINRAIAVNFPIKYNTFFSENKTTNIIVGVIWLLSLAQAFPYTFPSCSMQFHPESFTYEYSSSVCGVLAEQIGDLYVSITVVSLIAILDVTSFLRLNQLRAHHTDRRSKSKELRMFFQACAQSVLLMLCECSFFYLSSLSEDVWFVFATTSFIWVLTHCLDGVIVILFSREIRRIILHTAELSTIHPSMTRYNATIRPSTAKISHVSSQYI
uniref:G_PROTEIN_RECEP_F1_2 domain-containing protein n=1 Tax=Steinernema glaseri TaxID=37863 RepID=A0A1I8ALV8_9BILA